jgi:plasmid stabilization system protein ParE
VAYQVALADNAKADAYRIYDWATENAPFRGPEREVRCLIFGKRRGSHRILYEVDEQRQMVWILHVRHGALRHLKFDELAKLPKDE